MRVRAKRHLKRRLKLRRRFHWVHPTIRRTKRRP